MKLTNFIKPLTVAGTLAASVVPLTLLTSCNKGTLHTVEFTNSEEQKQFGVFKLDLKKGDRYNIKIDMQNWKSEYHKPTDSQYHSATFWGLSVDRYDKTKSADYLDVSAASYVLDGKSMKHGTLEEVYNKQADWYMGIDGTGDFDMLIYNDPVNIIWNVSVLEINGIKATQDTQVYITCGILK